MVSDIEKSVLFYTEIIGLKLRNKYGIDWAEIEAPGIIIALHPKAKKTYNEGNISIGFDVEDIDKTVEALKKKGVKFEMKDEDYVRLASFKDPDGTPLYLGQAKKY